MNQFVRMLRVANLLSIVVIFQLCAQSLAWDPSIYTYSRQLYDNYTIHWKVDIDTDQLYLVLLGIHSTKRDWKFKQQDGLVLD